MKNPVSPYFCHKGNLFPHKPASCDSMKQSKLRRGGHRILQNNSLNLNQPRASGLQGSTPSGKLEASWHPPRRGRVQGGGTFHPRSAGPSSHSCGCQAGRSRCPHRADSSPACSAELQKRASFKQHNSHVNIGSRVSNSASQNSLGCREAWEHQETSCRADCSCSVKTPARLRQAGP